MDAFSDDRNRRVITESSAQVGKTTMLENVIGYHMDQDPSPILVVQPTLEMGETFSKDRLTPMVRDTPPLKGKIADPRSRDSGNTLLHKALALDTPLATPSGWTTMGDVRVGDQVFDERGRPCAVTYVTPVMTERPCYRVRFSDGASLVADEDHPWQVHRWKILKKKPAKPKQVCISEIVTTRDLAATQRSRGRKKYAVAVAAPLDLPEVDLSIDPYILGAWLGDGLSNSSEIVAGGKDEEMGRLLSEAGANAAMRVIRDGMLMFRLDDPTLERTRSVAGTFAPCAADSFRARLRALDLTRPSGSGPSRKHIPTAYLRASKAQRLALLQGLMDTDGSIREREGYCIFVSVLPALVEGVRELLSSLGIKHTVKTVEPTYIHRGEKRIGSLAYRIGFSARPDMPIFRLPRKLTRQVAQGPLTTNATRRRVVAVEPVESVPVRCISVDSPSHLYLAGRDMVPTHNTYTGGHITIAGANSPASLASRPIRVLLCDEVDRFPVSAGPEGNPVKLAIKRTNNFWNRRIGLFSTPTDEDVGIDAEFKQSDQRFFYVPCPDCAHEQRLEWPQVKWTTAEDARYACSSCGSLWDEGMRDTAVSRGTWKATAPFNGVAGFHINELYSPWRTFGDIVTEFLEAKDEPEKLRVWVNTSLGQPWKQETTGVSAQALEDEAGGHPLGTVPEGALALTLGVDTQGNRLALQLVGHGRREEQWTIDNVELPGDPDLDEAWDMLTDYRRQEFDHPLGGKIRISMTAVDSGGHHAQKVVGYARKYRSEGVIAIKGSSMPLPTMLKSKPSKVDFKADGKVYRKAGDIWLVGTDTAKSYLMSKLRVDSDRRRIHFAEGLGSDYYRQLTAENYDKRKRRWVNPKKRRNEALDTLVYATAAKLHPWLRLDVATEAKWRVLEAKLTRADDDVGDDKPPPQVIEQATPKPAPSRFFSPPRKRGFVKNW